MDKAAAFCEAKGFNFNLTMGGLRAGGGVEWNDEFRGFLSEEWAEIRKITGLSFDFTFFDRPVFNYDTEPACRGVAAAQSMLKEQGAPPTKVLAFFRMIQDQFYARSGDPHETDFYRPACDAVEISFTDFCLRLNEPESASLTQQQFTKSRMLKAEDFPVLILEVAGEYIRISCGFRSSYNILNMIMNLE